MADQVKVLAILQVFAGFFLLVICISYLLSAQFFSIVGIPLGIWTCCSGGVGLLARKERVCVNIFTCCSFISAMLAGISILWFSWYCIAHEIKTDVVFGQVFCGSSIIICVVVIIIGMWVTSYLCCTCCDSIPLRQASSGVPVAVPMQAGGGIVALQTVTPGVQEYQPQLVFLPDSRAVDNPPPPYEAVASGYQNLQFDMPPSYEEAAHGEWRTYV